MNYDLLIQRLKTRTGTRYIDLQKRLENNESSFLHFPPFWRMYKSKLEKKVTFIWQNLKFSSGDDPVVSANTPGIYIFVLKPNFDVFKEYGFVMYVGMSDEGLIERLNTGYRVPSSVKARPNIHRLILDYGDFLHWYYMPMPGKTTTELKEIESFLVGYFCDPPINKKDAPHIITEAKKSKMN